MKYLGAVRWQNIWRTNTALSWTMNHEYNTCRQYRYIKCFFYSPKSSSCSQYSHFPSSCNISTFIYELSNFANSFCLCIFSTAKGLSYTVQTAQMHSRTPKYLQHKMQIAFAFWVRICILLVPIHFFLLSSYKFSVFWR